MANKKVSAAKKRYAELKKKEMEAAAAAGDAGVDGAEVGDTDVTDESRQATQEPEAEPVQSEKKSDAEIETKSEAESEPKSKQSETEELESENEAKSESDKPETNPETKPETAAETGDAELDAFDAAIAGTDSKPAESASETEPIEPEPTEPEPTEPEPTEPEPTEPEPTETDIENLKEKSESEKPKASTAASPASPALDLEEELIAVQEENDTLKARVLALENKVKSLESQLAQAREGSEDLFTPPPQTRSGPGPDLYSETAAIDQIRKSMGQFKDFALDMRQWQYMSGIGPIISI